MGYAGRHSLRMFSGAVGGRSRRATPATRRKPQPPRRASGPAVWTVDSSDPSKLMRWFDTGSGQRSGIVIPGVEVNYPDGFFAAAGASDGASHFLLMVRFDSDEWVVRKCNGALNTAVDDWSTGWSNDDHASTGTFIAASADRVVAFSYNYDTSTDVIVYDLDGTVIDTWNLTFDGGNGPCATHFDGDALLVAYGGGSAEGRVASFDITTGVDTDLGLSGAALGTYIGITTITVPTGLYDTGDGDMILAFQPQLTVRIDQASGTIADRLRWYQHAHTTAFAADYRGLAATPSGVWSSTINGLDSFDDPPVADLVSLDGVLVKTINAPYVDSFGVLLGGINHWAGPTA